MKKALEAQPPAAVKPPEMNFTRSADDTLGLGQFPGRPGGSSGFR